MPEGAYKAGTIFLQVVPVFEDLQNKISRQAKDINRALGDELEKGGRDAGDRAGRGIADGISKHAEKAGNEAGEKYAGAFESQVKSLVRSAQKEFKAIGKDGIISDDTFRDIDRVEKTLKKLSRQKFHVDFDAREVINEIEMVEGTIRALTKNDHEINVHANLRKVEKDLAKVRGLAEAVEKDQHEIKFGVKADLAQVERQLGSFEKKFKSSIKGAMDAIGDAADDRLGKIRADLDELNNLGINIDLDATAALATAARAEAELEALLNDKTVSVDVDYDIKGALASLKSFRKEVDKVIPETTAEVAKRTFGSFEGSLRNTAKRAMDSISSTATGELGRIRAELAAISDADPEIELDTTAALADLQRLEAEIKALSTDETDLDIRVDSGRATAELAKIAAIVKALDGEDVDIDVDVNDGGIRAKLRGLFEGANANDAANSFRSFNGVVLASALLIPALIPVIGALGGALLGLMPILGAVGAAFGAMFVGFSGIGDAVKAMGQQADQAGQDTEKAAKQTKAAAYAVADAKRGLEDAERSAGRAAADAARQVADARRQAADAIKNALDRQRDAQEAYRDSIKEVKEAEADLREARKRAAADSENTDDKIRQNDLAIRQAVLNAFDATNKNNAVQADGASTNYDKEQAQVEMLQSREALHELREEQAALAKEKKKQTKDGVNGSTEVKQAQDKVVEAIERQKKAQRELGKASAAVDRARADGARAISDALRDQGRVAEDNARSIARAREQLRRAEESYQDALAGTGTAADTAANRVEQAMDKLGPAGKKFARFIFGLRGGFRRLRDAVQEEMLPGVQRGMQSVIDNYGPQFTDFMARMGAVVGRFSEKMATSLEGPAWSGFFGVMDKIGPKMAENFGDTTINFLEAFASIMTAVAPLAESMSDGILKMSESFAAWAAGEGQGQMADFFAWVEKVGPDVKAFFAALGGAFANLAKALEPWGDVILKAVTGILDMIAKMDTGTLTVIASTVITMIVAWQAATGAVAAFLGGMSAFATPASKFIFRATGIVGLLTLLAIKSETFREILKTVYEWVKDNADILSKLAGAVTAAMLAWKIYKATMATVKAVQLGVAIATGTSTAAIGAQAFAAKVGYAAAKLWAGATKAMAFAQLLLNRAMMMSPVAKVVVLIAALVGGFIWAYKKIDWFRAGVDKVVKAVADAFFWLWDFLFGHSVMPDIIDGMMWFWGQLKKIFGWIQDNVIPALGAAFKWLWEKIIKPVAKFIGDHWDDVMGAIAKAWTKVLWPALKAIGAAFKWLWEKGIKPALGFIARHWDDVIRGMSFTWNKILWPAIKGIASTLKWLWENAIRHYLGLMVGYWKMVFKAMKWAWTKVLWPALKIAFRVIKWLWSKIIKPVLSKVLAFWKRVFRGMKVIWENILWPVLKRLFRVVKTLWTEVFKPILGKITRAWTKFSGALRAAWKDKLKPMFGKFKDALGELKDKFRTVKDKIEEIWKGLKSVIGKPIKFVIETVLNNGLIAGFNKVANAVGAKKQVIKPIPLPGPLKKMATGGVLPGYTPGRDPHKFYSPTGGRLELSGGEAIMRPEVTRALGVGWVNRMNAAARRGGVGAVQDVISGTRRYAKGGVFWPLPGGRAGTYKGHDGVDLNVGSGSDDLGMPFYSATSGTVSHVGYGRGYGNSIRINSPYGQLVYGHAQDGSIRVGVGQSVTPGTWLARVGDTGNNSSAPHLHFGFPGGSYSAAMALLSGAPVGKPGKKGKGGGGRSWPKWILKVAKNPIGYLKDTVKAPIKKMRDKFGESQLVSTLASIPGKIMGKVRDKMVSILPGPLKAAAGVAGKAAGKVKDGVGAAVGGVKDKLGFADGGVYQGQAQQMPYNGTMMYDSGGYIPPGMTTVMNLTGKPEPVFTAEQFAHMSKGRPAAAGRLHYEPHFEGSNLTSSDVAADLTFTMRRLERQSGKYTRP